MYRFVFPAVSHNQDAIVFLISVSCGDKWKTKREMNSFNSFDQKK